MGVSALALGAWAISASTSSQSEAPGGCRQEVIDRGGGWKEVGGPRAFVLAYPFVANPRYASKVFVRFEEDLERPITVESRLVDGDLRDRGEFIYAMPSNLSGSVHLVVLLFPRTGCWEVTLSAGFEVAGTARIQVQQAVGPPSTPVTPALVP